MTQNKNIWLSKNNNKKRFAKGCFFIWVKYEESDSRTNAIKL